ncbi:MAG: GAF domain-containing protein [Proteobacteria bacterium]|jgi:PAS domain S-box-containing protein|nr:GAF domain-containing protein [Pseudomonadota bacterium]
MLHEEKIVLMTEDELLAAEVARILHDVEIGVVRATGAEHALGMVRALRPNLVLLDAKLSYSGALEACRVLRSEIPSAEFGILVLVTDADDLSMADLLTNGADDVVSRKLKPWGFKARIASHSRRIRSGRSLAHKVRDSEKLVEITSTLVGAGDLFESLYAVASLLSEELDVTRCSVVLVGLEHSLGLVIASSDDPQIRSLPIDLRRYPEIMRVTEGRGPLVVADVSDSQILQTVLPRLKNADITSVALFPIARDEEIVGVIFLRFAKKRESFEDRELVFCQTVANATAIALRNHEILQSLHAKTQEVEQVQSEARSRLMMLEPYFDFFHSSVDGMVVLSDTGVVLFVNAQGSRMLGFGEEQVRGAPFSEFLHVADRSRLEALIADASPGGVRRTSDFTITRVEDADRVLSISAGALGRGGMTLLTMRDVTEDRATARHLVEARERLIESEKKSAMMEVAGAAAHELNQPLTSVMTSVAMMRRLLAGDDERPRKLMETVEREAERMASIIRRLSKLTEYTTKSYVGTARIIDLDRVADETQRTPTERPRTEGD